MHWFYYVGRFIARVLLFLFIRWRVVGRENVPARGTVLIVANHVNLADPPILSVSVGLKTVFMAKEELFDHWFTRYFVGNFGAFPVHRSRLDRKVFEQAAYWLGRQVSVVMFPEGTRSKNKQLQPAFPGSALIAARSCAPVLPVGIIGTEQVKGKFWWLRRPRITVNIGKPFYPRTGGGRLTKKERSLITHSIMEHIAELLPREYRGDYAKEERHED